MTKNEFTEYIKYLHKTLRVDPPTDKEELEAWYEPFKATHMIIAKKMAQLYLANESGYFKLAKLLEYKSRAMAGSTYNEPQHQECPYCGNTGWIGRYEQVEKYPIPTMIFKRCCCHTGSREPKSVPQYQEFELKNMKQISNAYFEKH